MDEFVNPIKYKSLISTPPSSVIISTTIPAFYPLLNISTLNIYLIAFQTRENFTQMDSDPCFLSPPKHAKNSGIFKVEKQHPSFHFLVLSQ